MSALTQAQEALTWLDGTGTDDYFLAKAQAYAAIAQAEAMQLLVKRLEQWMEVQGVGFEVIEAAVSAIGYQKENEALKRRVAILEGEPAESEYE